VLAVLGHVTEAARGSDKVVVMGQFNIGTAWHSLTLRVHELRHRDSAACEDFCARCLTVGVSCTEMVPDSIRDCSCHSLALCVVSMAHFLHCVGCQ
jgi:hypothetical protein